MDKQLIIDEIRRTAENGQALGQGRFASVTGIKKHKWHGIYWSKWTDAIQEAGYQSNRWLVALDESYVLSQMAHLACKLQKYPTNAEVALERQTNPDFPVAKSIANRWSKPELFSKLREYCQTNKEFSDVAEILANTVEPVNKKALDEDDGATDSGYVYLVQAQRAYKIGSTRAPYRRVAELVNQSAHGGELLHMIPTDDPKGIERYWHKRFEQKRIQGVNKKGGEWFALSSDDVRAFKKRKVFM